MVVQITSKGNPYLYFHVINTLDNTTSRSESQLSFCGGMKLTSRSLLGTHVEFVSGL